MLKKIGVISFVKETIDIDMYIPLSISWKATNKNNGKTFYWRTGDLKKSLLEIGINSISGELRSLTLTQTDTVEWERETRVNPDAKKEAGVPVVDTSNWPSHGYNDEKRPFDIRTHGQSVSIEFLSNKITSVIVSERVTFGWDDHQNLCCITVNDLSNQEMNELRDTLIFITQPEA